ncbi:MAG: class III signal peptide-containing protein [Candidatus Diapherotrites archaeon]
MEELKMDNKAQGALEYLLLIGGAVLIAVIVVVLLTGASTSTLGTDIGTVQTNVEGAVTNNLANLPV